MLAFRNRVRARHGSNLIIRGPVLTIRGLSLIVRGWDLTIRGLSLIVRGWDLAERGLQPNNNSHARVPTLSQSAIERGLARVAHLL